jgi:hypothetical protein
MYEKDGPFGLGVEMWVMNRLHCFNSKYLVDNIFGKLAP